MRFRVIVYFRDGGQTEHLVNVANQPRRRTVDIVDHAPQPIALIPNQRGVYVPAPCDNVVALPRRVN